VIPAEPARPLAARLRGLWSAPGSAVRTAGASGDGRRRGTGPLSGPDCCGSEGCRRTRRGSCSAPPVGFGVLSSPRRLRVRSSAARCGCCVRRGALHERTVRGRRDVPDAGNDRHGADAYSEGTRHRRGGALVNRLEELMVETELHECRSGPSWRQRRHGNLHDRAVPPSGPRSADSRAAARADRDTLRGDQGPGEGACRCPSYRPYRLSLTGRWAGA
jgi:hypothetical protein